MIDLPFDREVFCSGGPGEEEDASFDISELGADCEVEYDPENELPPPVELVERCREFFRPGGTLSQADFGGRPSEERPQQLAMAEAIGEALVNNTNLCVEAPTGVGKSFAYLVPLIFRALYCRRPAVISTDTIHLQEQLMTKDIPMLRELLHVDFKAALAKGRRNYVCRRRLGMLSGDQRDALIPMPSMALDLERLNRTLRDGTDGGRDSFGFRIDPEVWNLVCCETGNCMGAKCPNYRNCFYFSARRQWDEADIVVANHALFFTDLAMRCGEGSAGTLLPNYGAVLIDESHTLENNAAEHLGIHLSRSGVVATLNRLYNQDNAKGLLMRPGSAMTGLRAAASRARDEAYGFFGPYEKFLAEHQESALALPADMNFPDNLSPFLRELTRGLEEAREDEEDNSVRTELASYVERCRGFLDELGEFSNRVRPDTVYYAESDRAGVTLNAAPLNVPELLKQLLFDQPIPVMLCSATLTVRRSFNYYVSRTGFTGRTLLLDSPFSPEQAQLYVPKGMPEPASRDFTPALAREIPRYVEMTDGKAFVLFTSYQALRYCSENLRSEFASHGWELLVQGGDMSRSQLLREFREDVNSVLFGTDSFWTGVDVPGEALSNVIVTKLPFAVPSHPLIAARMRRIENAGGSSFGDYSLPEAVLKFRQGVGRLIRSRTDRGVIVILDPRIVSKSYGRAFLDSIPYRLVRE